MTQADNIVQVFTMLMRQIAPLFNSHEGKEESFGKKLAVETEPLKNFVVAEDYHQDYLKRIRMDIATLTLKRLMIL